MSCILNSTTTIDDIENDPTQPLLGRTKQSKYSPFWHQILVSSGPNILAISTGVTFGYSGIMLPQLEGKNNRGIKINNEQASWIASISMIPMIIGCIITSILIEKFGRRMTLIFTAIPCIMGWIIIGAATSVEDILIGRFLHGLCIGLAGAASSVYLGETSDPKYRGFLLVAVGVSVALGLFICHLLGAFLKWQVLAYMSVSLPVLSIILLLCVPESPTWLINKNCISRAQQAFYWCRGYSAETIAEYNAIVEQQTTIDVNKISWQRIKRPNFWKPLLIMNTAFMTSQFSGVNVIAFYSISIMKTTLGKEINEYLAVIVIDSARLGTSLLACILSRRYGRRILINISTTGTTTCLIVLSLYLYLSQMYPTVQAISAIPLTCLIGFIVFLTIGLVPLPWTMIGEVFPQGLRGIGSGICTSVNFMAAFIAVKTNLAVMDAFHPYGTFLCFSCAALTGSCILYFTLPETKDKTLEEVQHHFN